MQISYGLKAGVFMRFTKMHGCGNDYIYVNCFEEDIEKPNEVSKKLSKSKRYTLCKLLQTL